MHFGGQPWLEASMTDPMYSKYAGAWEKFIEAHPEAKISDTEMPSGAGRVFKAITKPALRLLLFKMLHPVPEKRICIQDVVTDRWLKGVECCVDYEEDQPKIKEIDAGKHGKCGFGKMAIRKCHNHLPPPPKSKLHMPHYSFDMGDGW